MESEGERIKQRRARVRAEFGGLFDRLSAILFEADPMGISFGSNTDEYEPEVETIVQRLCLTASAQDVEAVVHEEFCRWFGTEHAGDPQRYREVAARIWEEWCAVSNHKT